MRNAFLCLAAAVMTLCGCTRKVYVPVESVRECTDTVRLVNLRVDSVLERDTVSVLLSGDTVRITETKWRIRVRERHDTVFESRTDSVVRPVPYEVERRVEIEKPEPWWKKSLRWLGGIAVALPLLFCAGCALRSWLRSKIPKT